MVASVTAVTPNMTSQQVTFQPKEVREFPDRYEYVYETPATSGRKWGVGIASGLIVGLGQMINGDWTKGLAMLGGAILSQLLLKNTFGNLAAFGIGIYSIVDAVKNAKSKTTQVVPKQGNQIIVQA